MDVSFEDLTQRAKDLAYVAADKAKDAADLVRINLAIAGEQKDMDKSFRLIGEWFVSEYEGEIPDAVKDLVESVHASEQRIAELEDSKPGRNVELDYPEEAAAQQGQRTCPICGAMSDSRFCPQCGAPMGE